MSYPMKKCINSVDGSFASKKTVSKTYRLPVFSMRDFWQTLDNFFDLGDNQPV